MANVVERREVLLWQRDLESIFGRKHHIISAGGKRFYGTARTERFGSITAVQMFTEAAVEVRRAIVRSSANPFYHVFFIEGGETRNSGNDLLHRAPANTMMIVNGNHWYQAQQSERFRSLTLTVPAALMRSRMADVDQRCGAIISSRRGPTRVLHDYITSLLAQSDTLSEGLRLRAQEHLLDLITDGAPLASMHNQVPCVRTFIRTHLADPKISPAMAAETMGVSVRTIHIWMARTGTSFADYVREQRLERCLEDLLSAQTRALTITEIALRWGFTSSSTFSRQFHERFGMPPKAVVATGKPAVYRQPVSHKPEPGSNPLRLRPV